MPTSDLSPELLEKLREGANRTEISRALSTESDRGVAILLGEELSRLLVVLIETKLVELSNTRWKETFKGDASPLGSFSRRIKMASALGLVADELRTCLDLFRNIRNRAAHLAAVASFDDEEIQKHLRILLTTSVAKRAIESCLQDDHGKVAHALALEQQGPAASRFLACLVGGYVGALVETAAKEQ